MTITKRLGTACRLTPILAEMRDRTETAINGRAITERNFVTQEAVEDWADRIEEAVVQDMIDASATCYTTLADDVRAMREAQKAYFRTRSHDDLRRAKNLERKVDLTLSTIDGDVPEQGELPL